MRNKTIEDRQKEFGVLLARAEQPTILCHPCNEKVADTIIACCPFPVRKIVDSFCPEETIHALDYAYFANPWNLKGSASIRTDE